jgi:hypothetical protein
MSDIKELDESSIAPIPLKARGYIYPKRVSPVNLKQGEADLCNVEEVLPFQEKDSTPTESNSNEYRNFTNPFFIALSIVGGLSFLIILFGSLNSIAGWGAMVFLGMLWMIGLPILSVLFVTSWLRSK